LPVLDAAVDRASPSQILSHLVRSAEEHTGCSVVGISAPYATAMSDDSKLREAFLSADLLIPDGKGFEWGARMLGVPCPERIAIPDLCEQLLKEGNARGWKVFIYGATEELNTKACANVRERFPNLTVEGQHGYNQGRAEEDAVLAKLKDGGFHLLIVARPSPDKELFLARCCKDAGVVGLAAGGYADILAGKTSRAPKFVQAIGMEWLYRVVQEPGRLWKRVGWANVRFATRVLINHFFSMPSRPLWSSTPVQMTAIILAVVAAYAQSINAPYHFDDPEYIQENPTIRSFEGLKEIKVLAFRKVWWFSNAACYKLSEKFGVHYENRPDVRIFRAWNIACHMIAALALYGLLRRCVKATRDPNDPLRVAGSPYHLLPFIAAAIFAAHPLCIESVTYISGRDNGQGGMFYLLGLYFAAIAFERMRANALNTKASAWPTWFWPGLASLAFGACAILTKESHVTFPPAVGLVYLCFYRGQSQRTLSLGLLVGAALGFAALAWGAHHRNSGGLALGLQVGAAFTLLGLWLGRDKHEAGPPSGLARRVAIHWGVILLFAGIMGVVTAAFPYVYQRSIGALTGYMDSDFVRSLATQTHAVPQMLRRTIVPIQLNIDHDFPSIATFADSRAILGSTIILALLIFGFIGIYKRWVGAFGVLLALGVIVPTNTIIERGDIVSERNFYLVAAGGACFIAWVLAALVNAIAQRMTRETPAEKKPLAAREAGLWALVLGVCFAAPFTALTVLRNEDWRDPLRLWAVAREQSPEKLRVLYNFGVASFVRKNYDDAEWALETLLKIGEERAEKGLFRSDETVQVKCFHLGYARLAEMQLHRFSRASNPNDFRPVKQVDELFKRGLQRTAYDPDLTQNYAQFLFQLRRYYDAAPALQTSYNLHTWAGQLYYPLGVSYLESDNYTAARHNLERAKDYQIEHSLGVNLQAGRSQRSEPLALLALACLRLKDYDAAKKYFAESIALHPRGVYTVVTAMQSARNPKLKQVEMAQADVLALALSVCRKDLLETLKAVLTDHLKNETVDERGTMQMFQSMIDGELNRRAEYQKKRKEFGFKDDPDTDE
jgi:N-acetylglucosaminyldiphosphoundecaprenol N-acetyl-beta-D-mannosaminyltransferase